MIELVKTKLGHYGFGCLTFDDIPHWREIGAQFEAMENGWAWRRACGKGGGE